MCRNGNKKKKLENRKKTPFLFAFKRDQHTWTGKMHCDRIMLCTNLRPNIEFSKTISSSNVRETADVISQPATYWYSSRSRIKTLYGILSIFLLGTSSCYAGAYTGTLQGGPLCFVIRVIVVQAERQKADVGLYFCFIVTRTQLHSLNIKLFPMF